MNRFFILFSFETNHMHIVTLLKQTDEWSLLRFDDCLLRDGIQRLITVFAAVFARI